MLLLAWHTLLRHHCLGVHPPTCTVQVLLPEVHQVVGEVQARRLSGARLMQLLAARARSGMPAVQSCASRLLWHCYQVGRRGRRRVLVLGSQRLRQRAAHSCCNSTSP